jgi:hypothetical protein
MNRYILLAIPALALSLAGAHFAEQHADAQIAHPAPQAGHPAPQAGHPAPQAGSKTVDIQGPQGAFADKKVMTEFYEIIRDAHKQGDKADLTAMETKIKAMIPGAFNGGKPVSKAMEDHVLGVAHQALALGVSNPKLFDSYEVFMATMTGPK